MTITTLYTGGGVSLSPIYSEGRRESAYVQLMADEGKALKKGELVTPCVDVLASDVSNWTEIEAPPDDPDIDDSEALEILLGGDGT
jgi:hypothetical protein